MAGLWYFKTVLFVVKAKSGPALCKIRQALYPPPPPVRSEPPTLLGLPCCLPPCLGLGYRQKASRLLRMVPYYLKSSQEELLMSHHPKYGFEILFVLNFHFLFYFPCFFLFAHLFFNFRIFLVFCCVHWGSDISDTWHRYWRVWEGSARRCGMVPGSVS